MLFSSCGLEACKGEGNGRITPGGGEIHDDFMAPEG
jgi:hypothetical protein